MSSVPPGGTPQFPDPPKEEAPPAAQPFSSPPEPAQAQPQYPAPPEQPVPLQQPTPAPVAQVPVTPVGPERPTLRALLNRVKCHSIILTNGIGLGDALDRLSAAISRSGVRFDQNGNPTVKGVNKELGKVLLEALERVPRSVDTVAVSLGYDPARPMFMQGEALSVPIHSEMVLLLPMDEPPPIFPDTDMEEEASSIRPGV